MDLMNQVNDGAVRYPRYIRMDIDGITGLANHIYERFQSGTLPKWEYDRLIMNLVEKSVKVSEKMVMYRFWSEQHG